MGGSISGRQLNSVQQETLVVSATDRIVERKHNRPSPAPKVRTQTDVQTMP